MESQKMDGVQSQNDGIERERQDENLTKPDRDYKRDMLKFKDEANSLRDQLKAYEMEKEEAKGNLQNVISKLKDENRQLKSDLVSSKVSYGSGKIEEAIKRQALQVGCKDPDTFYKLIERTDIDTIELDSKFNVNVDDVKSIVDNYSKRLEHLGFFGKKVNIVDKAPNNKPVEKPTKTKSLEDMDKDELLALAASQGMKRIERF